MLKLTGILETALYVDDLARSRDFYERMMGLACMASDDRFCAYDVGDRSVLLLFLRGASWHPTQLDEGVIPPHDGYGSTHFAFSIAAEDLAGWEEQLSKEGIAIEGRAHWPRGGRSLFFRDPDGHLVELATPGIWPIF